MEKRYRSAGSKESLRQDGFVLAEPHLQRKQWHKGSIATRRADSNSSSFIVLMYGCKDHSTRAYANSCRQYWMALAISLIRSEPEGILYSNSMVA